MAISVAYCGLHPTSYTINNMYLWMRRAGRGRAAHGLEERQRPGAGATSRSACGSTLPRRLGEWFRQRLPQEGSPKIGSPSLRGLRFSFEPADIVNQIMSFGSPTPIEISVSGPNSATTGPTRKRCFANLPKFHRCAIYNMGNP